MNNSEPQYVGDPNPRTMFLEGPFGSGKTDFAIETLFAWLQADIPPDRIMIHVPQRTLARRYVTVLRSGQREAQGDVSIRTLNGLAQDTVDLFWPLVAHEYGFHNPHEEPRYLTIETAQYVIARFVEEAVENGEFDAIKVAPQTIARQVIDNIGKAALMNIPYTDIPKLLIDAWGDGPRKRVLAYQAAGRVAEQYRAYCLQNRLLDYGFQVELFNYLLTLPQVEEWFFNRFTHIISEHVEEEAPLMHDLLGVWLDRAEGMLITYEFDGGYRVFLGAEPASGLALRDRCDGIMTLTQTQVPSPNLQALITEVRHGIDPDTTEPSDQDQLGYRFAFHNFVPEMLDWVAERVAELVTNGTAARDIAILAPYLSDALLFSLSRKLEAYDIKTLSHRPSRALRDEPAARSLLVLTALAHPHWGAMPQVADVADALHHTIDGLDPVRAQLLAKIVYRRTGTPPLTPFENINPDMQARITYIAGERYDNLRRWLTEIYPERYAARAGEGQRYTAPLDHFFSLLFGEVLSQPGYGFHNDPNAGRVSAELIESAQKFRQSLYTEGVSLDAVGKRYFTIVEQGLLAALYLSSWREELEDAVFIAPAYTFLLRDRAVDYQFWLDVGSTGWWERLDQPLTHPYVLSRSWPRGEPWTDADETFHQFNMLEKLMVGLIRRARRGIYLGISDLGEQGFEQRGPLLTIFQGILGRHPQAPDKDNTAS